MQTSNLHLSLGLFLFFVSTLLEIDAEGTCELCPVDHYCFNMELNACPSGTTSLSGSGSLGDCKNIIGTPRSTPIKTTTEQIPESTVEFTTTPTSTPTGTPTIMTTTPAPLESIVAFTVSLQITLAAFDDTMREAYIKGVATALGTQTSNVQIGSVTEVVQRRRLLTIAIEVETVVTVPAAESETLASSVTTESLSAELGPIGIPVGAVSIPVVETVVPSTPYVPPTKPPPPPLPSDEWVQLGC